MTQQSHETGRQSNPGRTGHTSQAPVQPESLAEPLGLKRRHFMGTALALDAGRMRRRGWGW
jgi:hypothetical protein